MYLKRKKDTENKYRRSNIELTVDSEGENKENKEKKMLQQSYPALKATHLYTERVH